MPRTATQRFLDLDVEEVSLVDVPANESEFLVVKNLENTMPASEKNVQVIKQSANSAEDVATLSKVDSILKNIQSLVSGGNPAPAQPAVEATAEAPAPAVVAEPAAPVEKAEAPAGAAKTPEEILKAANLSPEVATALLETLKAALPAPVVKAEAEPAPISAEDMMSALAGSIQKAASFTPGRVKQMKEALEMLKNVLEGVSPTAVGSSPATNTPTVLTHPNPNNTRAALVAKADGSPDLMEPIVEALKEVSKRLDNLDAVVNARPAPTAIGDGTGGTSTETTQKNFWSGVL